MLEIKDLSKRYGDVVALDGASFTATPGRIVGFLGPNGAGKTTTMRCIFGLARPDRGETLWHGQPIDPRDPPPLRLHAGAARPLPADAGRRADELLRPAPRDVRPATRTRRRPRWLERLGLGDREKDKLEALSHGNQQRVQLGAALVHDPELLVLDEPFSGLDPIGIATMTEILRERAAAGVGVVFSSHQLDLVEDVCEDVVIIARGRIAAAGADRRAARRLRPAPSRGRGRGRRRDRGSTAGTGRRSSTSKGDLVRLLVPVDADLERAARRRVGRRSGPPVRVPAAGPVRAVHGGGAVMSRWRAVWLVARREILERGRSRAFLISLAPDGRRSSSPGSSCRRSSAATTADKLGVVGTPPAGFERDASADRDPGRHRGRRRAGRRTWRPARRGSQDESLDGAARRPGGRRRPRVRRQGARHDALGQVVSAAYSDARPCDVLNDAGVDLTDRGRRSQPPEIRRARAVRPEPRHGVPVREHRRDPPVHRDLHVRDVGPDRRRRGEAEPRRRGRPVDRPAARPAHRQGARDRPARARPAGHHRRRSGSASGTITGRFTLPPTTGAGGRRCCCSGS